MRKRVVNTKSGIELSSNIQAPLSNKINFFKLLEGLENHTTVMMRHVPICLQQADLLRLISKHHGAHIDYFYLPMDSQVSSLIQLVDPKSQRIRVH